MKKTAAIIQARTRSTRLPGKAMLSVAGDTILGHVVKRAQAVPGIDVVVVAIPEGEANDVLAPEVERLGAVLVRGSEDDVLGRYHLAAQRVEADFILRITSDCPLIDPEICSAVLALVTDGRADFGCNNLTPSWPHGLDCESFSFEWLDRAAREATKPNEREHVGPFMRFHPQSRKANLVNPRGDQHGLRWTLDYPQDLDFLTALLDLIPPGPLGWSIDSTLAILRDAPDLENLHALALQAASVTMPSVR